MVSIYVRESSACSPVKVGRLFFHSDEVTCTQRQSRSRQRQNTPGTDGRDRARQSWPVVKTASLKWQVARDVSHVGNLQVVLAVLHVIWKKKNRERRLTMAARERAKDRAGSSGTRSMRSLRGVCSSKILINCTARRTCERLISSRDGRKGDEKVK